MSYHVNEGVARTHKCERHPIIVDLFYCGECDHNGVMRRLDIISDEIARTIIMQEYELSAQPEIASSVAYFLAWEMEQATATELNAVAQRNRIREYGIDHQNNVRVGDAFGWGSAHADELPLRFTDELRFTERYSGEPCSEPDYPGTNYEASNPYSDPNMMPPNPFLSKGPRYGDWYSAQRRHDDSHNRRRSNALRQE